MNTNYKILRDCHWLQ